MAYLVNGRRLAKWRTAGAVVDEGGKRRTIWRRRRPTSSTLVGRRDW